MKMRLPMFMSLAALVLSGATTMADPLRDEIKDQFAPIPAKAPGLPNNPATPEKLALGKMLYFDPRLSISHSLSCASCHNLGLGGTDDRPKSLGHDWQQGGRNAPTVLNSVFNLAQFWDGRAADLAEQAGGPILNPVEMGSTKPQTIDVLKGIPGYVTAFKAAFPGTSDSITYENLEKAIAVFEATLLTPEAPFDRWLSGDDKALTQNQKNGLRLFVDKGCSGCHNGVNIGGSMYAPFGVVKAPAPDVRPADDLGRAAITKSKDDDYAFKVPTLRNIALTAPYFHSGKVWDLKEAVKIMGESQLGVTLSDAETGKIVDFLNSLTGRQPDVSIPVLPALAATTPHPVP
ncbi:cytochrome-c peroxidase [Beijerinckia indica]|uniref:Cytochrome-c peroxidase n=1 Tax=Beijerinckia indica subsp. indica (strain ATCC 9039 / DSM 1715 / NCIMB 8712) TaxID=395963 RepID=B2ICH0_BEII9|nr:cytochrome-c peroxidase [Beijerinckia indica]ACB93859.1 Cytochrome-c peroxidase [Beijerinckia indica subsp. indica ATCC 9039]